MPKEPVLLERQDDAKAGSDYVLEYQKAVLLALRRDGLLDQSQLNECIARLERETRKNRGSKI